MNIARLTVIGALLCLLLGFQQSAGAATRLKIAFSPHDFEIDHATGTRVSLPGTESIAEPGQPALPVILKYFRVESGRLEEVRVERFDVSVLTAAAAPALQPGATTFAGDQYEPADYYLERLVEGGSRPAVADGGKILTQIELDEGTLAVVAIYPLQYDASSSTIYCYQTVSLEFSGSADLQLNEIPDGDLRFDGSGASGRNGLAKPTSLSEGFTGSAEYLIISSEEFAPVLQPLVEWKKLRGISTQFVTIEDLISAFDGVDDAERLRNYLVEAYAVGTQYVLLAGDETILPIRYAYHSNVDSPPDIEMQQLCDLYFADLTGEWDVDGDGVYGEPSDDYPDITPELLVGRLPFSQASQFESYIEKLIQYETNPGGGDHEWLNRSLFVSADQMRDYQEVGQHALVAEAFPIHVTSDITGLVEAPSGSATNPDAPFASDALDLMDDGWGTMSLLIHGTHDGWVIRSSNYNEWPKSYLFTSAGTNGTHGYLPNLVPNEKPGLIYSIGCNNGAYDMDQPPFPATTTSVVESFLEAPAGGAVAFVGYTRWGWVATCWKIEKAFMEQLYTSTNNACAALQQAKSLFPYYRDTMYGLSYFGDPTLEIWTDLPGDLEVEYEPFSDTGLVDITVNCLSDGESVGEVSLVILQNDSTISIGSSTQDGIAQFQLDFNIVDTFQVVAIKDGHIVAKSILSPEILLDADDDQGGAVLPQEFGLSQNYPNPFNPTTKISFAVRTSGDVELTIFNVLGQEVARLCDSWYSPGVYDAAWDGRDQYGHPVASGVYFARLSQGLESAVVKMTLLK